MLLRHAMGSVLRRIRTERGATLRQLSERSRISIPYLSEIERGRKEASSEILAALCRVLDVTEGELLTLVAAEFAGTPVLSLLPERVVEPLHEVAEPARPGALLLAA
ncbi:helix-turn-helix transcriptional regulator [Leifsonia sp. NPDC080035]|uniref:Helix-turn-helix transcriptional regulator n=1 Tax=Leifsonia sp. NPDC080035 TaxID=3143936 RepID=A0AAU7G711_9MICO